MSTSDFTPPPGLPDVAALAQLANALFSAPPGGGPASGVQPVALAQPAPVQPPHGLQGDSVRSLAQPQSGLSDPHGIARRPGDGVPVPGAAGTLPASANGGGASPGHALPSASPAAWETHPSASRPEAPSHHALHGPSHGTSHGRSPGVSPGLSPGGSPATPAGGSSLPYADEQPFARELAQLLQSPGRPAPPQLPYAQSGGAGSSPFYFLETRVAAHASPLGPLHAPVSQLGASRLPGASPQAGQLPHAYTPAFDVERVKRDFPILRERVNGRPLVWLDNAATTQKPQSVIDRVSYFYEHENSNIHRAAHALAARATDAYEGAREKVRAFVNARSTHEIVFTRGTTESINLVAQTWGRTHIGEGDEIIVSHLEHHANIVPWHRLAQEKGARIRVIPVDDDGQIRLDAYAQLFTPRTRLVAFTQVSNALGTVTPAQRIIDIARAAGVTVLLDGAQSVSHMRVDLQALRPDFFVFSGHKLFGPTGIGVLYGREELLNSLPPWQGGGNMIQDVSFERIQYHDAPNRFEAGTGNIADAVGLGAAIDYVDALGIENIGAYEHHLLAYATGLIRDVRGIRLIGTAADKASVLSFTLEGHRTEEVGQALNEVGIAVRSGHHCAQPILRRFGVEATVRPSLAFYNTCADVDLLVETLHRLQAARHRIY